MVLDKPRSTTSELMLKQIALEEMALLLHFRKKKVKEFDRRLLTNAHVFMEPYVLNGMIV